MKEEKKEKPVIGRLIIPDNYKNDYGSFSIKEEFKGEVSDKEITIPKMLGAAHPFEFEDAEFLYKKFGVISGLVNRITDSVVADFTIKLDNPNAQALIDSFVEDTNFINKLRAWVKEAILKGNGFMELDLEKPDIRVMNSNQMYVRRNNKSKIIEYNQFTGKLSSFTSKSIKSTSFKPNEIAHLIFNKIPNDPYGIGYIFPNEKVLTNLSKNEEDSHTVVTRKAGAPYHFKVGVPGEVTSSDSVAGVSADLKFLTNKTEWVTDANTEIKMLDSPNIGEHHAKLIQHDFRMLLAGTGVPEVLMGSGQLNEGIARVQLEAYQRMIKSYQLLVQETIKEKIIRPILKRNALDEIPEFIWDLPGEEEINKRIEKISGFLKMGSQTSTGMRAALEIQLARLLDIEDLENILPSPQEAIKKEEEEKEKQEEENRERKEEEEEIPQPEVPGAKATANQSIQESDMSVKEWVNLHEIAGFNYTDYLTHILFILRKENFLDLASKSDADLADGLLTRGEVAKLRIVLSDGFKRNQTITQIEKELNNSIKFKDRLKDGKLIRSSAFRANSIVRTETVRVANKGLVNLYKKNKIENVRFLAALSDRTCPICEGLNGQVFNINELNTGANQPPLHTNCRCSLVSVVE